LAKPENCGKGIFRLKISAVYQICGYFPAKPELRKNGNIEFQYSWQNLLFKLLAIRQNSHFKNHVNAKTTIT